jgi:ring-1,2-phenylacetyl-CoA epoxidase subunit PaaA
MSEQTYGDAGIGNVTPDNFWDQPEEFREIMLNLIKIHVVSEDHGADVFERSMRMAKTVMEEYGHHVRFRELLEPLGIDWQDFSEDKDHLSTFDVPIHSWCDQMVFLALVDRAAAHQFRHFVKCAYEPFRKACQDTLNEEYGHVGFGMDSVKDLLETEEGRRDVEAAIWKWLPVGLGSFGGDNSKTNARYRHWGFKSESNEVMRKTFFDQVYAFITKDWGIEIPNDMTAFMEKMPDQVVYAG